MSNSVEPPTSRPSRLALEARDQALLAEDDRHPLRRPALERLAVARPDEGDDRVVAVLCAAAFDRGEGRVLVAQLLEDLVDARVVDGVDLRAEVEALVVAELDLGRDLDGRLEDERLPLLGLHDIDVGVGQRQDVLLDEGLAVGVLDEVLDGFVEDRAGTELALEDGARGLARPEAGDPRPARQVAHGVIDRPAEALGGSSISSWIVESGPGVLVICIASQYTGEVGRRAAGGSAAIATRRAAGRRERGRTSTPLSRHRLLRPARLPFRHSPAAKCSAGRASAAVRSRPRPSALALVLVLVLGRVGVGGPFHDRPARRRVGRPPWRSSPSPIAAWPVRGSARVASGSLRRRG